MHVAQMIGTHPHVRGHVDLALARCIEACYDCAQICTSCADACLAEPDVRELSRCIRLDLDCADLCQTTGAVLTRRTAGDPEVMIRLLEACVAACRACGAECGRHAEHHPHCRVCYQACRHCENACREAMASLAPHRAH